MMAKQSWGWSDGQTGLFTNGFVMISQFLKYQVGYSKMDYHILDYSVMDYNIFYYSTTDYHISISIILI